MKKNLQRFSLFLLTAILLSTCISCTPKASDVAKAEAAGSNVHLKDDTKDLKDGGEDNKDEAFILSVIGEPEGRDFLLFKESPVEAVFPEDFKIGPLQPVTEQQMDENESLIYSLAAEFATSIIGNDPNSMLIYNSRRDFLMRNLDDMISDLHLTGYRLGIINTDSEPATADLRFLMKDGFIEGTIYFINKGSWKIYDLQLINSDSSDKEKLTNEKWFPIYNKIDF